MFNFEFGDKQQAKKPMRSYIDIDENGRVHCSLNINTETGRLSARKPNLQNQPALDKDIYKIR